MASRSLLRCVLMHPRGTALKVSSVPCIMNRQGRRCVYLANNPSTSISHRHIHITRPVSQSDPKTSIISEITKSIPDIPLDSLLYKKSSFENILDFMLASGFDKEQISDIFITQPEILRCSISEVEEILRVFLENAFTAEEIVHILKTIPEIVESPENVDSVMRALNDLGFMDKHVRKMLNDTPEVLLLKVSQLSDRYNSLMQLFRKNDIQHMLRKDLGILLQSKEELSLKVDYVYHKMGLDQVEMVWANILCHSLEHIRARHLFLDRAGKYEKPDSRGSTRTLNPYLKDMLGTTDKDFVRKVAGLSLEEYHVFKKIVLLERELKQVEFDERFDTDDEGDVPEEEEKGYKSEKVKKQRMRKQRIEFA